MKRLLVLMLLLLAFSAPAALAQSVDPAAYLPSDIAAYVEIRTNESSLPTIDQLASVGARLSGIPTGINIDLYDELLRPTLGSVLDFSVRAEVVPWVGGRIGIGVVSLPTNGATDVVIVLPIEVSEAAQPVITKLSANTTPRTVGGVRVYEAPTYTLAVGSDVMWIGSPLAMNAFLQQPMFQRLTDNPAYQTVRAALPTDSPLTAYISGEYLLDSVSQTQANTPPDQPTPATIIEAALRLHPAESEMETALLANGGFNGVGFAIQSTDASLDVTGVASVNAQYPAPTLTTATAGTALLQYVPSDSFLVFDSYDVSALVLPVAGLAYLGPSIGNTFDSIVMSLEGGTPPPTPTPTPTPTPVPPPTADDVLAQLQPIVAQIESTMGMSLDELYSLTNGEYAVAVFPGAGPTIGAALYLQSSDPQRLIDTIDHVSELILIDPAAGTPLVGVEHQTVSGIDVALLGVPGAGDRPAVGIIGGDVLFVTMESALSKVISASTQPSTTPALNWRDSFGTAQEALVYADLPTIDLYATRQQRVPALPFGALAGTFDMRDDGLFVLNLSLALQV
jgi:hypothetical protein